MQYTKIKQKFQITIPSQIRKAVGVDEGEVLEVGVEEGRIVLTPLTIKKRIPTPKSESLLKYLGATKNTFGSSTKKMDEYLQKERESWD